MFKIVFLLVLLTTPSLLRGAQLKDTALLHTPASSLLRLDDPGRWSTGFRYEREDRELREGDMVRELNAGRLGVYLAYSIRPWAIMSAGMGASVADLDSANGEYGLDWNIGARIGILEHAISHTPLRGKTRLLRLDAGGDFRQARSHFTDANFRWQEWRIMPTVTYMQAAEPYTGRPLLHPESTALRAGMVFSGIDGRSGGIALSENRNFGLRLGADVRLLDGWIISADVIAYQASETSITAGIARQF